jgi:hypothetical protein
VEGGGRRVDDRPRLILRRIRAALPSLAIGDHARQPIEPGSRPAPATGFDVMSREDIARALRINPALLTFIEHGEPGFPGPILQFRDGPIWDAEAVERWIPTRQPQDQRRTSVPRT